MKLQLKIRSSLVRNILILLSSMFIGALFNLPFGWGAVLDFVTSMVICIVITMVLADAWYKICKEKWKLCWQYWIGIILVLLSDWAFLWASKTTTFPRMFMLLAITACRPNYVFVPFPGGNGGSASSDKYQEIADKVDPATLVNDVLQSGKTGIDVKNSLEKISSKISRAATTRTALDDGNYNLTARVEFTDYPTAAGKITGGVLVYTIPGTVSSGTFTATGSGSVKTAPKRSNRHLCYVPR